jgi:nicotinate-nucleotide pyrophosphorylase (carboxylating)
VVSATDRAVRRARAAGGVLRIRGTRKTVPGLRRLQKAAIVSGGGDPHRADLASGILVKNNHLALVGVEEAVRRARAGSRLPVQVEVRGLAEALRAVRAGADALLLDNRSPAAARRIVRAVRTRGGRPRIRIELSGGITEATLPAYAQSGADWASLGALTHSAPALPFHLTVRARREPPA